jgi:hypothetical protein
VSLLTELDAFFTEHRRCGELDGGVDWLTVWLACDCGASIARRWTGRRMTTTAADLATDVKGAVNFSRNVRADPETIVAMSRATRERARQVLRTNRARGSGRGPRPCRQRLNSTPEWGGRRWKTTGQARQP